MIPSVSIVMPSYNHAAYVAEAIRSVLDQSHGDLEIVITDDGSRDGTPDVIRRLDDSRISLEVFDRNQGAAAAMNASIRRSRGEFICMLASDDCFLPGKLETQVKFLRAIPRSPRYSPCRGSSTSAARRSPTASTETSSRPRSRKTCAPGRTGCGTSSMRETASAIRPRWCAVRYYDRIGLFDRRLANLLDFDMWVRMCMEHEIRVIPNELTAMRILDGSRNMSAPRRDTNLRWPIEYFHILKHYRGLPRAMIAQVFAREIASAKLDAEGSVDVVLGELALLGVNPLHKLFALDSMFDAMRDAGDPSRLIELTGAIDVFAIETVRASPRLLEQVAEARAEAARLSRTPRRQPHGQCPARRGLAGPGGGRAGAGRRRADDRAQAAPGGSPACGAASDLRGAARLDDQLGTEQANRARMTSALQAIQDHASAITTRSRAYRLLRLLTGLRRRIEMIAGEASRALDPDGG